jgi:hypothetical protein
VPDLDDFFLLFVLLLISIYVLLFWQKEVGGRSSFSRSICSYKCRRSALSKTLAIMAPAQTSRAPSTTGSVQYSSFLNLLLWAALRDKVLYNLKTKPRNKHR